jgi:hypothetical protein
MSNKKNSQLTFQLMCEYLKYPSNRKGLKHGFSYPCFSRILMRKKRFRIFLEEIWNFYFILSESMLRKKILCSASGCLVIEPTHKSHKF